METRERTLERRFEELAAAWIFTRRSVNTQTAYESDLAGFFAWCASAGRIPVRVTAADVEAYRLGCEAGGASPPTIARRMSALSSFYRFAADHDAVPANPADRARRPPNELTSATAALPAQACADLLWAARRLGPKTLVLVSMLLHDGLKVGEALSIDVGDVAGTARTMTVAVTRRGRPQRIVLDPRTWRAIDRHLAGRRAGPLLLGDSPGTHEQRRLTRFGANYLLKRASQQAGIVPAVTANRLRCTYIAAAHANGATLDDIRHHVGHRDSRTTRRFLIDESTP